MPTFAEVARTTFGLIEGRDYKLIFAGSPRMELLRTRQTIYFKTANRPDRLVGPSVSHISGTELGLWERVAYEKSSARLRCPKAKCRQYLGEGTPEGFNWWQAEADIAGEVDEARNYRRFTLWTSDNRHLPSNYVDNLARTYAYDAGKLESYLFGRFVPFTKGTAYWEFRHSRNVTLDLRPTPQLPILFCWDFNISPLAWVVAQKRIIDRPAYRFERYEALAESSGRAKGILDACVEFMYQFPPEEYRDTPIQVYGDPSGYAGHVLSPNCAYDQILQSLRGRYRRVEICAERHAPEIKARLERTNALLAYERLLIGAWLKNTISSFSRTSLKEGTWKIEKPSGEDWTHYGDALGYMLFQLSSTTDLEPLSPRRRWGINRPL